MSDIPSSSGEDAPVVTYGMLVTQAFLSLRGAEQRFGSRFQDAFAQVEMQLRELFIAHQLTPKSSTVVPEGLDFCAQVERFVRDAIRTVFRGKRLANWRRTSGILPTMYGWNEQMQQSGFEHPEHRPSSVVDRWNIEQGSHRGRQLDDSESGSSSLSE